MSKHKVKRVALLTDGVFPLVTGGMQKHSYYLLSYLLKRGVEVLLYHCAQADESITEHLDSANLDLLEEVIIPFPPVSARPDGYMRSSKQYAQSIADDLNTRKQVDYVYAQGFTPWALIDQGYDKALIGVNFHGLEMFQYAKGIKSKVIQRLFRPTVSHICQGADVVYSLGGKLTQLLEQIVPREKVREVPIGIEESWLRPIEDLTAPNKSIKAVFIGRYERRKGIEELHYAMKALSGEPIDLHMIGPIPAEKQLDSQQITYYGLIKEEGRIQRILDSADFLLVPSLSEGMPTVILEAMARGLAVIASDVGAVNTEVDQSNGYLITPGDEADLLRYLREAMAAPADTILAMKKASRKRVEEQFLWSRIIDLTLDQMAKDISSRKK